MWGIVIKRVQRLYGPFYWYLCLQWAANSPLEQARLFCFPLSLNAAFVCEKFMPWAIRFPKQNDQKYGFHKVLLCAWNGVHNE